MRLFFLLFCLLPFGKNETVNGIIGKTQGVNKAINPPKNPKNKISEVVFRFFFSFIRHSLLKDFRNPMKKPLNLLVEEQFLYFQLLQE